MLIDSGPRLDAVTDNGPVGNLLSFRRSGGRYGRCSRTSSSGKS
ncbi:hypothetical protein ACW9HJ_30740 [Nocardia gipuzkoensis]